MDIDHFKKLWLVQFKSFFKNYYLGSGSIIAILFSILFRFTLSNASFNGQKGQFILVMAVFFNSIMSAIMMTSIPISKSKEMNISKRLVSYNIIKNLLATLVSIFLIIMGINILLPLLSGVTMEFYFFIKYAFITILLTSMSMLIGLLIGFTSRKIVNTSFVIVYTVLFLILIPLIGISNSTFEKISDSIYSGILLKMLMNVSINKPVAINVITIAILVTEFIILVILFFTIFKNKESKAN